MSKNLSPAMEFHLLRLARARLCGFALLSNLPRPTMGALRRRGLVDRSAPRAA